MSYLTSDDLTDMRNQVAYMLPDTAILYFIGYSSDGEGGGTASYTAISGGTVTCRLDPVGRSLQNMIIAGQEATVVMYQLTLPYDAPLAENVRITISGNNYEVIQMDKDHSWNVSRRAIVKEIR